MATPLQIVIDCANPAKLAHFWATALGYVVQPPPEGYAGWEEALAARGIPMSEWNAASAVIDPRGAGPRVYFQRVQEPKAGKNRVHLDLRVGGPPGTPAEYGRGLVDAEAQRLADAGATIVAGHEGQWGEYWVVMLDPEGNEFCVT